MMSTQNTTSPTLTGSDARGTYTGSGSETLGMTTYETGNEYSGDQTTTLIQSHWSTLYHTGGMTGSNAYTQTVWATDNSTATDTMDGVTGQDPQTTTDTMWSTTTETGSSGSTSYNLRDTTSVTATDSVTDDGGGDMTDTHWATSTASMHEMGMGGTGDTYTLDKTTAGYETTTEVGAGGGAYEVSGTQRDTSTSIETNSQAGGYGATFTEILTDTGSVAKLGDYGTGDYTLSPSGTRTDNYYDVGNNAAGAYTVTEGSTASYVDVNKGNSGTGEYDNYEVAPTNYSMTETVSGSSGYTLTESGLDSTTVTEDGSTVTGLYTRTETGPDTYTLTETGTASGGTYTESVTGTDVYSETDTGNTLAGTSTDTTTGGGIWTRTSSGDGATRGSGSGTNAYTLTVTGDAIAGVFSQTEYGTGDRYGLVQSFNNVANTGATSPGNVTFHGHGVAFEDPEGPSLEEVWSAVTKGSPEYQRRLDALPASQRDQFNKGLRDAYDQEYQKLVDEGETSGGLMSPRLIAAVKAYAGGSLLPPASPSGLSSSASTAIMNANAPLGSWWSGLSSEERNQLNKEVDRLDGAAAKEAYLKNEFARNSSSQQSYENMKQEWNAEVDKIIEQGKNEAADVTKKAVDDQVARADKWQKTRMTEWEEHLVKTRRGWLARQFRDEYPPNDPDREEIKKQLAGIGNIINTIPGGRPADFEIGEDGTLTPITVAGKNLWDKAERVKQIAGMTPVERVKRLLELTIEVKGPDGKTLLEQKVIDRIRELISPEGLAVLGTVLSAWAASHYFGVGETADAVVALLGYALLGADAIQVSRDVYTGIKVALNAKTDSNFEEAAKRFANGLSIATTDIAIIGGGAAVGKAAPVVKNLVRDVGKRGLGPVVRDGVVGVGRKFRSFIQNESGTAWLDADARSLNRILQSQGKELTGGLATKLEEAVCSGKITNPEEAVAAFKKVLADDGLNWSRLSKAAQDKIETIAKGFAAPKNAPPAKPLAGRPHGGPAHDAALDARIGRLEKDVKVHAMLGRTKLR